VKYFSTGNTPAATFGHTIKVAETTFFFDGDFSLAKFIRQGGSDLNTMFELATYTSRLAVSSRPPTLKSFSRTSEVLDLCNARSYLDD